MNLVKVLLSNTPRPKVKFQVVSDLHLEVGQQYADFKIVPYAPRLILAGDIGRLADYDPFRGFLNSVCEHFIQVFLVLGNHEFFGVSRSEGLGLAKRMEEESGLKGTLVVMNRRRIDLHDPHGIPVSVLGCTLQSYVPPVARDIVRQKINDFRRIKDWTVEDHCEEHALDVAWLTNEINLIRQSPNEPNRRILVITHHAPSKSGTSDPVHEGNAWNSAFGTDLLSKGSGNTNGLGSVQAWVFGHTHYCTDVRIGKVRVIGNQRGYVLAGKTDQVVSIGGLRIRKSERSKKTNFDVNKVIAI